MRNNTHINYILLCLAISLLSTEFAQAYKASDFHWRPPFTTSANEKASISLILDSSITMAKHAYANTTWNLKPRETSGSTYDPTKISTYYGYFEHNATYSYNIVNNYFYKDANGGWSGGFLNWASMRKIDVSRKILTGGYYNTSSKCYEVGIQPILTGNDKISDVTITCVKGSDEGTPFTTSDGPITIVPIQNTNNISITYYINKNTNKTETFSLRIYDPEAQPRGVLDDFKSKARFALFKFVDEKINQANEHEGGYLLVPMTDTDEGMEKIKTSINTVTPVGQATPLAESLYTVEQYVRNQLPTGSYSPSITIKDPFYFENYGRIVPCTQQNVIMITGGESSYDEKVPYKNMYPDISQNRDPYKSIIIPNGSTYVITTAYNVHSRDLRTDTSLPGKQNINIYTVFAFGKASLLLKHASIWGGFNDKDGDNKPTDDPIKFLSEIKTRDSSEYNSDHDDYPDNYFEALTGTELEFAITAALDLATRNLMSGTAAAVTSQTRSGEGAVYQALFFPPNSATNATQIAPPWSGQIHAFLLDSNGNMREDTNKNRQLDVFSDKILQFQDIGNSININLYTDTNGDSILSDDEELTKISTNISNVNFLWSSTNWLDSVDPTKQRTWNTVNKERYILTLADSNNNGIADSGEVQNFLLNATPSTSDIIDPDKFYSYLTLYESTSNSIGTPTNTNIKPEHFPKLAKRQVDFIRGLDMTDTISGTTVEDPIRSRIINGDTWRLGDIVYSSPTIVGQPSENYHTLYNDATYKEFYYKYKNRRQVIYSGANDGMLHAFNGGFYNSANNSFDLKYNSETQYDLGAELWAYVPYNLLPHLRWLMDPDYGDKIHVPYMDLKPRIFDARVFSNSTDHPSGWGTLLIAGMRFGGAKIHADLDKSQSYDSTKDRTMSSAYVVMDITNPEIPPVILGEIRMPKQGFTTCYPTVMPMSTPSTNDSTKNKWYLVFGSGPASSTGEASASILDSYQSPDISTSSDQAGQLYIVDLNKLVQDKKITTISNTGTPSDSSHTAFATTESYSYISDPIAVDLDIGSTNASKAMKTDLIYYGTVTGKTSAPYGSVKRLRTNNIITPSSASDWSGNSTLIQTLMPITSAPSVAVDNTGRIWVYFGAGRFFNRGDIPQQYLSFFGIKEPTSSTAAPYTYTWNTVQTNDLYDSSKISVTNGTCGTEYTMQCVSVTKSDGSTNTTMSWEELLDEVDASPGGWRYNFDINWERVLGQPAILGGAVLFTSYLPNPDICAFEGDSRLYGLYYKTGTPYYQPILSSADVSFAKFVGLGKGMAITPNIHIGDKSGSTAFIQTSTGAIQAVEIENPINVKSGQLFWRKNTN